MSHHALVESVCECQAKLGAELDDQRHVVCGWAISRRGVKETSPAHSIDAGQPQFRVAWLCPLCGRNTLRSFDAGYLSWKDAS